MAYTRLGHRGYNYWLIACLAPNHLLNLYSLMGNCTSKKISEVLIKIGNEILEKMQLECGVFKVATIFFISQYGSGHEGAVALLTGFAIIWFCYQMIAKPGNKTAVPSWPDTYGTVDINNNSTLHSVGITPCRPRRNHTSGSVAHAMQFSAPSDHRWNKSCSVGDHGTSSWTCGDKTNPKKKIIYWFFLR